MSEGDQKVGDIIKPLVTPEQAEEILLKFFGLKTTKVAELNSYDDQNFRVNVDPSFCSNSHISSVAECGYVLKVANIIDSENVKKLELQNMIMIHMDGGKEIQSQLPVRSVNGQFIEMCELDTPVNSRGDMKRRAHAVRLLTFIPGELFKCANITPKLCYQVGVAIGQIDVGLSALYSEFTPVSPPLWNLVSTPRLLDFTFALDTDDKKKRITDIVHAFQRDILPRLDAFKKGVIHGDPNEQNILVNKANDDDDWSVSGILDWQDSCSSYLIFDLAIVIMYTMTCHTNSSTIDIKEIGHQIISGFTSVCPMSDLELRALPLLVACRYAQSLCIGEYTYRELDPNNVYVLVTAGVGWSQLQDLWENMDAYQKVWLK